MNRLKKIVIDAAIPYIRGLFEPYAEVLYLDGRNISAADVADADAVVVRTRTKCDAALLDGSAVKLIATATIGFDHIDIEYCRRNDIEVRTAAGCNARGVLQWVSAVLAYLSRTDGWQPRGMTLGVVGVGNVGSLVAEYGQMWGFKVLRCDPPRQKREGGGDFVELDYLLRQADVVTFHTPLDESTHHLLNSRNVGLLWPQSVVLNSSRGAVVDNEAVVASARRFVFDVWEQEPQLDRRVLQASLLSTPHVAGYSAQGKATATSMAVSAVAEQFGLPLQGWFPDEVSPSVAKEIEWGQMCRTITSYFDIESQSRSLRLSPESFEPMRDTYIYREEYF